MFYKKSDTHYIPVLPGIERKTLVYGEKTLLTEFRLQKNVILPRHTHPQEQAGYLVSGRMRLILDMQTYEVEPGDSWCIPGNVPHSAEIIEDSIAIEVFSPVRTDYLPEREE